jgi:hypothetical protein
MIYEDGIYNTVEEYNQLVQLLKKKNPLNEAIEGKRQLLEIMTHTEYTNLRGKIAIYLSDTRDKMFLPVLIDLIKSNIHTKYIGSLIYAAGQYDCHEYIETFVDVIIVKTDMTVLDSYSALQNVRLPVDLSTKNYCINKLTAYMEQFDENERLTIIQTIDLLKNMKES